MPVLMLSSFSFSVSELVENMVTKVNVKNATCTISTQSTTGNLQAQSKVDSIGGSDCAHLSRTPGSDATWVIHHWSPRSRLPASTVRRNTVTVTTGGDHLRHCCLTPNTVGPVSFSWAAAWVLHFSAQLSASIAKN